MTANELHAQANVSVHHADGTPMTVNELLVQARRLDAPAPDPGSGSDVEVTGVTGGDLNTAAAAVCFVQDCCRPSRLWNFNRESFAAGKVCCLECVVGDAHSEECNAAAATWRRQQLARSCRGTWQHRRHMGQQQGEQNSGDSSLMAGAASDDGAAPPAAAESNLAEQLGQVAGDTTAGGGARARSVYGGDEDDEARLLAQADQAATAHETWLTGHVALADRAFSQHALLGGRPDPLPGNDPHPHGPDLAEVGSWGTRWQSCAVGTSATGAPVRDIMVDALLSAGRTSPASEQSLVEGTLAGVLGPAAPPAAARRPAAADVMANAATRPQPSPHGDGVRVGELGVPTPGAGVADADDTDDGPTDGLALGGRPLVGLYPAGSAPAVLSVGGRPLVNPTPAGSVDARVPRIFTRRVVAPLWAGLRVATPTLPPPIAPASAPVPPPAPAPTSDPLFGHPSQRPPSLQLPSPPPPPTRPNGASASAAPLDCRSISMR